MCGFPFARDAELEDKAQSCRVVCCKNRALEPGVALLLGSDMMRVLPCFFDK